MLFNMNFFITLSIFLTALILISTRLTVSAQDGQESFRLPQQISPHSYRLTLLPIFEDNPRLCGHVWINVTVLAATSTIVLHALNILPIEIIVHNKTEQMNYKAPEKVEALCISLDQDEETMKIREDDDLTEDIQMDEERERIIIILKEDLVVGAQLQIGVLYRADVYDTDNTGFFRIEQKVDEDDCCKRWIGATQLEAIHARKVFPCLDEPAFKATFETIVGHDSKLKAISNMPLKSTRPLAVIEDWVWDTFEPTPNMSSYLVAFVLSQLDYLETSYKSIDGRNVTIKLWSRKSKLSGMDLSYNLIPRIMVALEEYLQIPYSLPKLDIVALPGYDSNRAMENWGLIIQSETDFILEKSENTGIHKTFMAQAIIHELAHQWFGNLVTSSWWDDIWMNEGLSTIFENIILNQIEPQMEPDQVVVIFLQQSLFNDRFAASLPLAFPVELLPTIDHKFDGFAYAKGSAIFRMIKSFVGDQAFKNALRRYFVQFRFKNANSTDLWTLINQEARRLQLLPTRMNIIRIMKPWTHIPGYPLIHVTRNANGTLQLTQEVFIDPDFPLPGNFTQLPLWWVPISLTYGDAPSFTLKDRQPVVWLSPNRPSVPIDGPNSSDVWTLLNLEYSGYYRVNYDQLGWQLLADQLLRNYTVIPPMNRAQLIDDVFTMCHVKILPYQVALKFVEYLAHADDEAGFVRSVAAGHAGRIQETIANEANENGSFNDELLKVVETMLSYIIPPVTSARSDFYSSEDLDVNCITGEKSCVERVIRLFHDAIKGNVNSTQARLMKKHFENVWCTVLRHGGSTEWNYAWSTSRLSSVKITEKRKMLKAMSCSNDVTQIKRLLSRVFHPNINQRPSETLLILNSLTENQTARRATLHFVMKNWTYLNKHFRNPTRIRNLLLELTRDVSSIEDQEKVTEFLEVKAKELGPAISNIILTNVGNHYRHIGIPNSNTKYGGFIRKTINEL